MSILNDNAGIPGMLSLIGAGYGKYSGPRREHDPCY